MSIIKGLASRLPQRVELLLTYQYCIKCPVQINACICTF